MATLANVILAYMILFSLMFASFSAFFLLEGSEPFLLASYLTIILLSLLFIIACILMVYRKEKGRKLAIVDGVMAIFLSASVIISAFAYAPRALGRDGILVLLFLLFFLLFSMLTILFLSNEQVRRDITGRYPGPVP
jgi:hypothetical protein